ncbi:7747_t:CDS:2, partial [Paraglomus occultum]
MPARIMYAMYPLMKTINEQRRELGIEPVSDRHERTRNVLFLANTFFGFEVAQPLSPMYREVGPIMSDKYPDLDTPLHEFLSTHEKTVYISFGSRAYLSPKNNGIILQSILESINAKIFDGAIWSFGQTTLDDFPSTIILPTSNSVVNVSQILHAHPHIRVTKGLSQQFATLNHSHTRVF